MGYKGTRWHFSLRAGISENSKVGPGSLKDVLIAEVWGQNGQDETTREIGVKSRKEI